MDWQRAADLAETCRKQANGSSDPQFANGMRELAKHYAAEAERLKRIATDKNG